jgi:uncharacterized tellurite resistance protein B-like protein
MGSTPKEGPDTSGRIQRATDRPLRRRKVEGTPEAHVRELGALAELMLGAAWADGSKAAVEVIAIAEQLKEFVETTSLPTHVSRLMDGFDPATFDPASACALLRLDDNDDRLAVISLLARVVGADKVLHPAEQDYLDKVATALGLDPKSLTIRFS